MDEELQRMASLLVDVLTQPDGRAALDAIMRYLAATHDRIDWNKLRTVVEAVDPQAGEDVVTVYEQLVEEGRQKGRAGMLLHQLATKFGAIPAAVRARVMKASSDELRAWTIQVLTATSLEEALASPAPQARTRRSAKPRR